MVYGKNLSNRQKNKESRSDSPFDEAEKFQIFMGGELSIV